MKDEREAAYIKFKKQAGFDEKCSPDGAQGNQGRRGDAARITADDATATPSLHPGHFLLCMGLFFKKLIPPPPLVRQTMKLGLGQ
jgi:hypothetical protein